MNFDKKNLFQADITNCEREPIHIPGRIQAHGFLLAVTPDDYTIIQASENVREHLDILADQLIGTSLNSLQNGTRFQGDVLTDLLKTGLRNQSLETMNPYRIRLHERDYNLVSHQHDNAVILEFEPVMDSNNCQNLQRLLAQSLSTIKASWSMDQLLENAARQVKKITGYDRVMIYKFWPDWHGEVVAEVKEDHLEPFLGLHYPASDIPRQARELYKTNRVRCISNVNQADSALFPVLYANRKRPLDLAHSILRAVSPVHIEYLKNMGVQASMSISLMYQGELWGLISCHNATPRQIDYSARMSVDLVGQLLSAALEYHKDEEDQSFTQQIREAGQTLFSNMLKDWNIVRGLTQYETTALNINSATGAALFFEGKLVTLGQTPSDKDIHGLIGWLQNVDTDTFFQTSHLAEQYPPAAGFSAVASGLLAIPLSRELNEYLLWFKPEQVHSVSWAGNPEKAVNIHENGSIRISPRKSFARWVQEVCHTAEPWKDAEIATALKLREDILHVVAKKANEIRLLHEELRKAYEELDAFSYTVSHDLRSPLSTIKSYSEIILEEYGEEFNDDARTLFTKVIRATDRMNSLIRNIMDYSRMGQNDLLTQLVDMRKLLHRLREDTLVTEKGRPLTIHILNTPPVAGDPTMVLQVFSNLLSNAAKYSRQSQPAVIEVNGFRNEYEVVYSVKDNGIGIDMKQSGRVFDLFKRLDNTGKTEGNGVGLSIVKQIMSRHKGKVWFDSEPNRQTTFYVAFPHVPVAQMNQ
ncbi:ATP-binding protein [Nibrella saemangeumensis]|uniref:histidine kinase n=1 Tax=Nibrella saemangeumensis TaxID=1084526 RepID=A0ABP8N6H3_9BACT